MKLGKALRTSIPTLLFAGCAFSGALFADDQTIAGNLTINPAASPVILDLTGPSLYTGTGTNVDGAPGLTLSYHDGEKGTAIVKIYRPQGEWQWQIANPGSDDRLAMKLGNDHALTLFDPENAGNGIVFQPGGPTPGITVNGVRLLTPAAASAAYMPLSPLSFTAGGSYASASGYCSAAFGGIALGDSSFAQGTSSSYGVLSAAFGDISYAYGQSAFAAASGQAYGDYSFATGGGSAGGNFSCAVAGGAAAGSYSFSAAYGGALGDYSTGIGLGTCAYSYGETVVGSYNTIVTPNSATAWDPADNLFVIGNGAGWVLDAETNTYSLHHSDALVVKKNGEVHVNGPILTPQQGDLSMGSFTAGTQP